MAHDKQSLSTNLVCIHQPDFFPWMGFFNKIVRSNAFVLIDHVQIPKTGGSYCNRVKLLVGGSDQWVTAPIKRNYQGFRAINRIEFQSEIPWREKFLKTVLTNYRKAPFFEEAIRILEPLITNPENNLSDFNRHAILAIADFLNISTEKIYWSSQLPHEGSGTELLISLTRAVGGDAYMCGGGASGYQEDLLFHEAGITLTYQNFNHPVYPQIGTRAFIPGLSIIDALMNIGVDEVRAALHAA